MGCSVFLVLQTVWRTTLQSFLQFEVPGIKDLFGLIVLNQKKKKIKFLFFLFFTYSNQAVLQVHLYPSPVSSASGLASFTQKFTMSCEKNAALRVSEKIFNHLFFWWNKSKCSRSVVSALCDPMDCRPPGSSVHGILQPRILEWVAISFSRGSSRPRDRNWVFRITGRCFTLWATREAK